MVLTHELAIWLFLTFLRVFRLWSWLQCEILGSWFLKFHIAAVCPFNLSSSTLSLGKWRIIRKRLKEVNCWLQALVYPFYPNIIQSIFMLRYCYLPTPCFSKYDKNWFRYFFMHTHYLSKLFLKMQIIVFNSYRF